jgi:predicted O-methyltransferase YrrM
MTGLFDYYLTQTIRPTHADFSSDTQLSKYAELRKNVFNRLTFPITLFSGKRVLEFGPDTGENSLVFAKWGARVTLVEPNEEAHSYISRYFTKFQLDDYLDDIIASTMLEFSAPRKFDVIDAEGFVYTIQPTSAWVKKAAECLEPSGFLIISHMELYGSFIELLTKAIYQRVASNLAYGAGIETAKRLFQPRWDSVQHTRKFDSWFMDVIENPYVRMKYFIDPVDLLRDMQVGGFQLYSSWPNYKDTLAMQWIKAPLYLEDEMLASISFVEQSRLSHLLGCKCFIPGITREEIDNFALLIRVTDGLIDEWSQEACATAEVCVDHIEDLFKKMRVATNEENLRAASEVLAMTKSIFQLMGMNDVDRLVEFCRNDETFISTWGMPNHYAVFQRSEAIS